MRDGGRTLPPSRIPHPASRIPYFVKLNGKLYVPSLSLDGEKRQRRIVDTMQRSASSAPGPDQVRRVTFTPETRPAPVIVMAAVRVPASDGFCFSPSRS